jgi:hypothetical protein
MHPLSTKKNSISPSWRPLTCCAPPLLVVDTMVVPSVGRTLETAPKHPAGYQGGSRCSQPRFSDPQKTNTQFRYITAVPKVLKRSNNHPKTLRFFLETWQLFEGFEVTGTGGSSLILVFPNTRRRWSQTQNQCWFDLSNTLPGACCCQCWGSYRNFIQNQDGYFPGSIPKPQQQMSATKTNLLQLKGPMTRKNRPI